MTRGTSGRMVVELGADLKRALYAALVQEGLTFKEWLTQEAQRYLASRRQPSLFPHETPPPATGARPSTKRSS